MNSLLILASASPRRKQLLEQAGVTLEIAPASIDESPVPGEPPLDYAARMAAAKLAAALREHHTRHAVVLAADTVVHREGVIFDKPPDRAHAARTLAQLSDSWHQVTTAFAVGLGESAMRPRQITTRVRFRQLSAGDIERYLDSGEALDKAGAYGIQGRGGSLIDQVEGSYTNVVGLPLAEVLEQLRALDPSSRSQDPS